MDENYPSIELKDFMECLRDENNRLLKHLSLAQKCMKLFEDYRKCLIGFANSCLCDQNFDNQMTFNRLELNYKSLVEEDMRMSALFHQNTINIGFNKHNKSIENNHKNNENKDKEINLSNCVDNQNENENHLSNQLSDNLKNLKNDEEYRLMYLKRESDNCLYFACNWFKCAKIFGSESSLSQHISSEHFRVYEYSDNSFVRESQEMIIKCEPDLKPHKLSQIVTKSKPVFEEYVCEWIGCELEFKTQTELKRHEILVHNKQKQTSVYKTPRFTGLKPLTIHSLDLDIDLDQSSNPNSFTCDLCDKSFNRKESLRHHLNSEHKSDETQVRVKMFYCDHCEYETKNNSHMKRHILRRHTNERPYKCDLGDCHPGIACFATKEQLKSHQTNKHLRDFI